MVKYALKFGIIIVINLFAFLIVGNILDSIFGTGRVFLVVSLLLSIIPLSFILMAQVKKIQAELDVEISKQQANGNK